MELIDYPLPFLSFPFSSSYSLFLTGILFNNLTGGKLGQAQGMVLDLLLARLRDFGPNCQARVQVLNPLSQKSPSPD